MALAYAEALKAMEKWDYPIWAIMLDDAWNIISGRNERNTQNNRKSHAEINLIKAATNHSIANKILYVTLEPCKMCTNALLEFWIKEINFILEDPFKWGLKDLKNSEIIVNQYNDENNMYLKLLLNYFPSHAYIKYRKYYEKKLIDAIDLNMSQVYPRQLKKSGHFSHRTVR